MKVDALEKKLLHYTGKAIADYRMIEHGDKLLICVSGGKDSYTLLWLLRKLQQRAKVKFTFQAFTLDQVQPGWDDSGLEAFYQELGVDYKILSRNTYKVVLDKLPEGKTYCSLCSRLRRGHIYTYAEEHGFNKVVLGHHRDDLIESLLMSIIYNGEIKSMPPKLLTDSKKQIVIRPLVYCQEADIAKFAELKQFPIIPCNLCGSQENLARKKTKKLLQQLAADNPKIPANMLHALQAVKPSQLMDHSLWDFKSLSTSDVGV